MAARFKIDAMRACCERKWRQEIVDTSSMKRTGDWD
jgi:hypothetical protein